MEENLSLHTDSNFSIGKTSKLKGLSMELLIKWAFKKLGEESVKYEETISRITSDVKDYMTKVYRIRKNFNLIDKNNKFIKFGISSKDEDVEITLDTNIINENYTLKYISTKEETEIKEREEWDGKWSICSKCKKFARTQWLKEKGIKKCWRCKQGFFNKNIKRIKEIKKVKKPFQHFNPFSPNPHRTPCNLNLEIRKPFHQT